VIVRVHGKNMVVDEDLRELADTKVGHAGRIFDEDQSMADVEFAAHRNPRVSSGRYRVEITTGVGGQVVRVEAQAQEERAALDLAVDKFERQLRRLKERLIQRNRKAANKQLNVASGGPDEDTEGPAIVRTKRFAMRPMTPEEAVLQMEMLGHDFFFFMNAESGTHCVIYHRRDGAIGLLEPE
jgi:putative sigma-54 modulation protein